MSVLTEWGFDGPLGLAFTLLTVGLGGAYALVAEVGRRRDRRSRRWPAARTASFLAGVAMLVFAIDSGVGTEADTHLAAHMVEHMIIWVVAAPLLVAGAPLRLALFALRSRGRRRAARILHSRPVAAATGPLGSTVIFCTFLVVTQVPVVLDLTLRDELVHVAEHAIYLVSACLVWAPLIGADPLPHRPGRAARCTCGLACMLPMALISVWLLCAHASLYAPYREALGAAGALRDQRLAGLIMLLASAPAIALTAAASRDRFAAAVDLLRPRQLT